MRGFNVMSSDPVMKFCCIANKGPSCFLSQLHRFKHEIPRVLIADHAYFAGALAFGALLSGLLVASSEQQNSVAVTAGTRLHVTLGVFSNVRHHLWQLAR